MKKLVLAVTLALSVLFATASAASAAGSVCYEVHVSPGAIDQAGCQALP
jgi:hypothetical protein